MRKYLAQRLLIAIPTLFGVTLLIFIAMRVLPGDPLAAISGEGGGTYVLSKEQLAAARASLGLDRPLRRPVPRLAAATSCAATWGNRSGAASPSAS